jgi:hypothetical protein
VSWFGFAWWVRRWDLVANLVHSIPIQNILSKRVKSELRACATVESKYGEMSINLTQAVPPGGALRSEGPLDGGGEI